MNGSLQSGQFIISPSSALSPVIGRLHFGQSKWISFGSFFMARHYGYPDRLNRVNFTHIRRRNPLKVKRVEITRHEENQQSEEKEHHWRTSAGSPFEAQARREPRRFGRATRRARHRDGQDGT